MTFILDGEVIDINKVSAEEFAQKQEWGMTNQQFKDLGIAHLAGNDSERKWIEDFLTECNFHTECKLLKNHLYREYQKAANW